MSRNTPIVILVHMRKSSLRLLTWALRLFSLVLAFWWPAILRDPVYTPRHARLSGQELRLPPSVALTPEDEHAMAIFWQWEHRSLVTNRWSLGPWRGIRDVAGRTQTFIALVAFWIAGSVLLARLQARQAQADPTHQQNTVASLFSTPLWQWFARRG